MYGSYLPPHQTSLGERKPRSAKNMLTRHSSLACLIELMARRGATLFILFIWMAALSLPSFASEDDALRGWQELNGKALTPLSEQVPSEVLWTFSYGKEPSVLMRTADNRWKTALEISFSIRSDKPGRLFLRIDQDGGKIFLTSFDVTQKWRKLTLPYADFQPFGLTFGKIEPARIAHVYLVDLNGSDGGAEGTRQVFFKELTFHDQAGNGPSGRLPLVAFNSAGHILSIKEFEAMGTSGGRWCYLSDEQGAARPMEISKQKLLVDGEQVTVPMLVTESTIPAMLEILYWPVGDTFKVRLKAEGNKDGIQGSLRQGAILINLELAKSRHFALSQYVKGGKVKFTEPLQRIGKTLDNIDPYSPLRQQAAIADQLLLEMLNLSRDAVRSSSRDAIASLLEPGPATQIPTPQAGALPPGSLVTIQLEDPAFRIGIGQGFGFVTKPATPDTVDKYYTDLRDLGFNMSTLPLYWDKIIDKNGNYTPWRDTLRFDTLARLAYTLHAHGFVQSGMPASAKKLKGEAFLAEAKRHTTKVATDLLDRYGDRVEYWQAINEPSSNAFGGTSIESRLTMVSDLIKHLRNTIPQATVVVNDYDWERGLEAERPATTRTITGTIPFYKELMKKDNKPDVLAVEWYPGCRVDRPEFRVDLAEPCMDLLDASFYWDRFITLGRPLLFTESNFPGSMRDNDRNGYAWGRWSAEAQAQAAVDTFLLALSKPEILGWVWWSITDDEPWNSDGGLYTSRGLKKPVLERLATEISALKKITTVRVEADGSLALPRMPGTWRISVNNGSSWLINRSRTGELSLKNTPKISDKLIIKKNAP